MGIDDDNGVVAGTCLELIQTRCATTPFIVHIWEYKGYPGHHNTQARLAQDPVCSSMFHQQDIYFLIRISHAGLSRVSKTAPPIACIA